MSNNEIELPAFAVGAINLASPRMGSEVVEASDEFFAAKERVIMDTAPVFIEDKYDENGKWMDGWESRRRRDQGHDWCVIKLGVRGAIRGVDIDTSHFTGNFPPAASLEACLSETRPDENTEWTKIVRSVSLGPDAHHFVEIADSGPWNWLRLNILPDGGIARLRVYGEPEPVWTEEDRSAVHELSALKNGGRILAYNNAHFGDVWALLSEGRGVNMGDGWETRRRREPGYDWMIIQLGGAGTVERIEVDTAHFKGNFPDRFSIQAARFTGGTVQSIITRSMFWEELAPEHKLGADAIHVFEGDDLNDLGPITHVKLNIFPDGGVSRFRIFGRLAGEDD